MYVKIFSHSTARAVARLITGNKCIATSIRSDPSNEFGEKSCHSLSSPIGSFNHIIGIVHKIIGKMITFIGYDRHTKHPNTTMTGYDYFRHRTHSDRIATRFSIERIFGRRFIRRTCQTNINTFL